ncbi:MAG: hypothetical protein APF81_07465 [Desulfosporosinus sp. BRH_c37]|nr:MAG: hypothetical protein APF81_07465 [Desulfosporosinus sp. BRH_c37]
MININDIDGNQAVSMLRFVGRVKQMIVFSIFTVVLFVSFFVFQSMGIELRKSLTDNFDRIVYDLSKQIDSLSTEKLKVLIFDNDKYRNLLANSTKVTDDGEILIVKNNDSLYSLAEIYDIYVISTQKQASLFEPIKQLTLRLIIGGSALFLFLALFIYFYIIDYARRELGNLELSRNAFKKIAYIDQLTGAYSRQFLVIWNTSLRSIQLKYAIIMVDIDDFKKINDVYGHSAGDEVLRFFGATVLESIRQRDLFFRYGGDEFVLILSKIESLGVEEF